MTKPLSQTPITYQLPDRRRVDVPYDVCKSASTITYTLKDGRVVEAVIVSQRPIDYTPNDWTPEQAQVHQATDLDEAFHHASCLSGGWYYRAISIDMQHAPDNTERYMLRPSDVAPLEGWTPTYEVKRL